MTEIKINQNEPQDAPVSNEETIEETITISEANRSLNEYLTKVIYPAQEACKARAEKKISQLRSGVILMGIIAIASSFIAVCFILSNSKHTKKAREVN